MNVYEQMREAITKAEAVIDGTRMMVLQGQEYDLGLLDFDGALNMLRAALALPRRNCDVGTADEQSARYDEFCYQHRTIEHCCANCPVVNSATCELAWAQTPYAAEEGGAT